MVKELIIRGFARSLGTYSDSATIQRHVSEKLASLVLRYKTGLPYDILELGCGTGFLTENLLDAFPNANWTINDINSEVRESIGMLFQEKSFAKPLYVFDDAEKIPFDSNYDLIISSACIQWFSNLPLFLNEISNKLNANGLLAFSTFGSQNLTEIKMISGKGLNYYTLDDYTSFLNDKYEILYCSEDIVNLYFDDPYDVLKHIKSTGVNGAFRQHWTKSNLAEFMNDYKQFQTPKGYTLTYHPIYFICKPK